MKSRLFNRLVLTIVLVLLGAAQAPARSDLRGQAFNNPDSAKDSVRLLSGPDLPEEGPSYAEFFDYVRTQVAARKAKAEPGQSALAEPSTLSLWPRRQACPNDQFAIAIDLDPDPGIFNPDDPPLPFAGLAGELTELRAEGVKIVWVTDLMDTYADRLRTTLAATELDASGSDVLVMASQDQSKHDALRQRGAQLCLVAIAGDRIGDFEQAYDHLRDKTGPLANILTANLNDGWFLTPVAIS